MFDSRQRRDTGRRGHPGRWAALAGTAAIVAATSACSVPGYSTHSAVGANPPPTTAPAAAPAPPTAAPTTTAPPTAPPTTAAAVVPTTLSPVVTTAPVPTVPASPHFDTPEAAMTYLASAWNRADTTELMQVTTPIGRLALSSMSKELVNLQLDHCTARTGFGDYVCFFDHDALPGAVAGQPGARQAQFIVAPALTPGWYMTVVQVCG